MGGKLLGIVTSRDIDFVDDRQTLLKDVMTQAKDLVGRGLLVGGVVENRRWSEVNPSR